jgi:hypothetical protein
MPPTPNRQPIQVTLRRRHYSPLLSSFEEGGTAGFTLVIGVARAPQSKLTGHIDNEAHLAFATLNRKEYNQLWKEIWASPGGRILLEPGDKGSIANLSFLPKSAH